MNSLSSGLTRSDFLRRCTGGLSALAALSVLPKSLTASTASSSGSSGPSQPTATSDHRVFDLREFEPSVRRPGSERTREFSKRLTTHSVLAAISLAAEAQQFLRIQEVVTERPLRLVLDRRPFI